MLYVLDDHSRSCLGLLLIIVGGYGIVGLIVSMFLTFLIEHNVPKYLVYERLKSGSKNIKLDVPCL